MMVIHTHIHIWRSEQTPLYYPNSSIHRRKEISFILVLFSIWKCNMCPPTESFPYTTIESCAIIEHEGDRDRGENYNNII